MVPDLLRHSIGDIMLFVMRTLKVRHSRRHLKSYTNGLFSIYSYNNDSNGSNKAQMAILIRKEGSE
jgi:hypothetical protein